MYSYFGFFAIVQSQCLNVSTVSSHVSWHTSATCLDLTRSVDIVTKCDMNVSVFIFSFCE